MKLKRIQVNDCLVEAEKIEAPFFYQEREKEICFQVKRDQGVLQKLQLVYSIDRVDRIYWNGFQSWSSGGVFEWGKKLSKPPRIAKKISSPLGDYHFASYAYDLHSFQFVFLETGEEGLFLGSQDESRGYTIFHIDYQHRELIIEKDCMGEEINGSYGIIIEKRSGSYQQTLQAFGEQAGIQSQKVTGWTSWYNYYTEIDEKILFENLGGIEAKQIPFDIFQIDDGYQHAVGDWLTMNTDFPNGLIPLVEETHRQGMEAGLWLAPFVAEKKSNLIKNHPEWVLRDELGKMIEAGWNPGWSGSFYALDLQNQDYRAYMETVFKTVFESWKFDMVKLDFLYAGSMQPRIGASRGRQAQEALDWIRAMTKGKKVLLCGAPFSQIHGFEGYARIGSDVKPKWEDGMLSGIHYRERVSTKNSLVNTILRGPLNGVSVQCDPDVFFLRGNVKMSEREKRTLHLLNYILGNLLFTSDPIHKLDSKESESLKKMFPLRKCRVSSVKGRREVFRIEFAIEESKYVAWANLSNSIGELLEDMPGVPGEIQPRDCLIQKVIQDHEAEVLDSDGHWIPGQEIEMKVGDHDLQIQSLNGLTHRVEIIAKQDGFSINGEPVAWKRSKDRYVATFEIKEPGIQ